MKKIPYRIGQGYDVHRFGEGDHIVIGGIRIPYEQGLIAHSDGDVLLHALCDALLGAIAEGDIGRHFPDNDPKWADANSLDLLADVYRRVQACGYQLLNADMTLIAQAPRFSPHIKHMVNQIAAQLDVDDTQINVKATTTERLGFEGRKEGIAASASVMLGLLT